LKDATIYSFLNYLNTSQPDQLEEKLKHF